MSLPISRYPLLESIKIQNNRILNLPYHKERIRASLQSLYSISDIPIDFGDIEEKLSRLNGGKFKLRILYNPSSYEYSIQPYSLRIIHSLRAIKSNLDYRFKYSNRSALDNLFEKREETGDILIVKNDFITDTYYCNVALSKNDMWYTPEAPLLKGTKRQQLLDQGMIYLDDIKYRDLQDFGSIRLFNAMIEFGEIEIPVSVIQ